MKPTSAANRSIRRSSTLQRTVVKSAGASTAIKSGKTTSWSNILDVLKARLRFSPRDFDFPEVVIQDASPSFARTFGFAPNTKQPLSALFGKCTARAYQFQVERAMLTGQTSMDYVNLHRADGAVLSCHVVVRSIPSGATAQGAMLRKNHSDERYAIISIRSASAMGNASFIGVGLLGVDRIPPAVMERAIDGAIAAQAQESPAVEALQLGNMEQFDDVEAEGLILD